MSGADTATSGDTATPEDAATSDDTAIPEDAATSDDSVAVLGDLLGLRPFTSGADIETHRAFPNAEHPKFYVPVASRRAAAASCLAYNRLRPASVARRRTAVGWGLRSGLLQRAQGTPMTTGSPMGRFAAGEHQGLGPLADELSRRLGRNGLSFATSPRSLDPFWTPTLQLFAADGTPVAYAKVGWTPLTRRQVETEAAALAGLSDQSGRAFRSPELLDRFDWGDTVVSVAAPMPNDVVGVPSGPDAITDALLEVANLDGPPQVAPFASSGGAAWADSLTRESPAGSNEAVTSGWNRFEQAWAGVRESIGDSEVLLGRWHGDWVPWNLAKSGETLWVWDWEYSGERRPVGLDAYHWHYQQSRIVDSAGVVEALRRSRILGAKSLDSMGVGADTKQVLASAHVLELAARSIEAAMLGAPGFESSLADLDSLCDELMVGANLGRRGAGAS